MKLPNLPDLNDIDDENFNKTTKENNKTTKKNKPKIPKSEYDENGDPILMVPDIDDIKLSSEINRYFGNYGEGD